MRIEWEKVYRVATVAAGVAVSAVVGAAVGWILLNLTMSIPATYKLVSEINDKLKPNACVVVQKDQERIR